jgi:hypothetical protein
LRIPENFAKLRVAEKAIVEEVQEAGYKSVEWNANEVASGVYFYRLEATSISDPNKLFTQVRKMILLR